MRNDLLKSFVFLALTFSRGKEVAGRRNNLSDIIPGKSKSSLTETPSSITHECLYIAPDLPVCDFERMQASAEDVTRSTTDFSGPNDRSSRERRNADPRKFGVRKDLVRRHLIVYTIEGCYPPRLPFTMPSCQEENSRGKIVEVRKLYPFTVKGLTKPPLVFPEFNFDRWMRMMKRLRSGTSSAGNTVVPHEVEVPGPTVGRSQRRRSALMKEATTSAITPNAIIASTNVSKGSSPKDFILRERPKSLGTRANGTKVNAGTRTSKEDSRAHVTRCASWKNETRNEPGERWKKIVPLAKKLFHGASKAKLSSRTKFERSCTSRETETTETVSGVPGRSRISHDVSRDVYSRPIISGDAANDLGILNDPDKFQDEHVWVFNAAERSRDVHESTRIGSFETNDGIKDDLDESARIASGRLRETREIKGTSEHSRQRIQREPSANGIPGKSNVKRSRKLRETVNSGGNGLDGTGKRRQFLHSNGNNFASDKHGVGKHVGGAAEYKVLKVTQRDTMENLTSHSEADVSHPTKVSHDKIDVSATPGPISRKSFADKIASRKKYGKYSKSIPKDAGKSSNDHRNDRAY